MTKSLITILLFCAISGDSLISKYVVQNSQTLCQRGYNFIQPLFASRMPVFDEDDEEQLRKIMAGEFWEDEAMPDFSDNLPTKMKAKTKPAPAAAAPSAPPTNSKSVSTKKVTAPNADWRTITESTIAENLDPVFVNPQLIPKPVVKKKIPKPVVKEEGDFFEFTDLDYDDFESAMREEENGGFNPSGGGAKETDAPEEHEGLDSADVVPPHVWKGLIDAEGLPYTFESLHKNSIDLAVIYADPRRMTDEFKVVLNQFNRLPLMSLKVASCAINCDDTNDHRKYVKKNKLSCTLLSDPSRQFMDAVKSRMPGRIMSSMMLLDVKSNKVLKIWYENDWDAFTTKDLLVEEIKAYRQNPVSYIQSQIGIR